MKKVLLCLFLFSCFLAKSQHTNNSLWKAVRPISSVNTSEFKISTKNLSYQLDITSLNLQLQNIKEGRNHIKHSETIIYFPDEHGQMTPYRIASAPVLSEPMQAKYPSLKSYIGESLNNPNQKIRFSNSPTTGLSATIFDKKGSLAFIQKKGNQYHIVNSSETNKHPVQCTALQLEGEHEHENHQHYTTELETRSQNSESNLKILRLALLISHDLSKEILQKLNMKDSAIKALKEKVIVSYLNSLLTNLNAVFERDIAVSLQLVENNESLIFLSDSTYHASTDLNANQKIFDELIGSENYDIGHTLVLKNDEGVLGWSYVGSVGTSHKAGGFSTVSFSNGLSVLLHEIGHQFGASHTYNNISGTKTDAETSVEVGKGKTIMSYGQVETLFYHGVSVLQMKNFIEKRIPNIKSINTKNSKPLVNAGKDYVIPKQTPFLLKGNATDADNKSLSYSWEQIDKETGIAPPSSAATRGPLFSWTPPTKESHRFLPNLSTILNGKLKNKNEALAALGRELNFMLIVRDNNTNGGETGVDTAKISVDENAGPFQITSHNNATNVYVNEEIVLTWDVANTDKAEVNTPFVDISFSKDEGQTFPIQIASKVANKGSYRFRITKDMQTKAGRFMIKGHENIFIDINDAPITVKAFNFLLIPKEKQKQICFENTQATTFEFTYQTDLNSSENVHFEANLSGNASALFTPASASKNGTKVTLKISNISKEYTGKNCIEVIAKSTNNEHRQKISIEAFHNTIADVTLLSPKNISENLGTNVCFKWQLLKNTTSYLFELAEDKDFKKLVISSILEGNECATKGLKSNTIYFWRIKALNPCSEGAFSKTYQLKTGAPHCDETYIPDKNFERALIELGYDSGNLDSYVYTKDIDTLKELKIANYGIQDLTGIEDFRNLEVLSITNAYTKEKLRQINLSNNKKLRVVTLSNNSLENLSIENLTKLQILICNQNDLKSIHIANNPKLKHLSCYGNQLDACSLDAIFIALPKQQAKAEIFLEKHSLSNLGVATCNTVLLQGKNWEAKKYSDTTYSKLIGNGTGCSNHAPVADTGESFEVKANMQVTLDASASYDIDGDTLHYEWTAPTSISLTDKNNAVTNFTAPEVKVATKYEFQLTVSDQELVSQPARITVTVLPTPKQESTTTTKKEQKKKITFDGDIFQIKAESPTCPDSKEGIITLTNNSNYDFIVSIASQKQTVKAQATNTFTGLASGEYPMTCTLENDTTQKITDYIVVVPEPKMFAVTKEETRVETRSVNYVVEGATEYHLQVNHTKDIITFADEKPHLITIQLPGKKSFIRISPASSCKGNSYEELVFLDSAIEVYPRVSKNLVYIDGLNSKEVEITLITRKGNTVLRKKEAPVAGRCAFDISNLNDNIYFVNISGQKDIFTTYVYKRTL